MAHLIDQIWRDGTNIPYDNNGKDAYRKATISQIDAELVRSKIVDHSSRNVMTQAEVFYVDNVTKYYYQIAKQDVWYAKDFPNVAPPYPAFWMETRRPDYMRSEDGTIIRLDRFWDQWGALFLASPFQHEEAEMAVHNGIAKEDLPKIRWVYNILPFFNRAGLIEGPLGIIRTFVYYNGQMHVDKDTSIWCSVFPFVHRQGGWLLDNSVTMHPFYLALSFLHCKNVQMKTTDLKGTPLAKSRVKKHGVPGALKFHILEIDAITKILNEMGRAGSEGLKHALHICRGHFKTYTEDAPLFGKHVGTYWWDNRVRGTSERGISIKDYSITRTNR